MDALQNKSQYDVGYLQWKRWSETFGSLGAKDKAYFKAELGKLGQKGQLKVLELGFGNGSFLTWARQCGWEVTGTEANPHLLAAAAQQGFAVVAAEKMAQLPDGHFDLVVAFDVLEHIPAAQTEDFLRLVKAKLCIGGIFLARFPNGDSPFALHNQNADPTHCNFIGEGKIRWWSQSVGLKLLRTKGAAEPILCGNFVWGLHRLVARPIKALIEFCVRAIFFPQTPVHFTSSNLVAVWQKPAEPTVIRVNLDKK